MKRYTPHKDFHRRNVGDIARELRSIAELKKKRPFSRLLYYIMGKDVWEQIRGAMEVNPTSLLKLHRAYREYKKKKDPQVPKVLTRTYHPDQKKIKEEEIPFAEYLERIGESIRSPHKMSREAFFDIVRKLHFLAGALEREECKENCTVVPSPYPEFIYDRGKDRYHYIPSSKLAIFEEIGIPPDYILHAHPNRVLNFLKQSPKNIQQHLQTLEEFGLPRDYILRANPNTVLAFLASNPQTIQQRLQFYEKLGLPRDYILRAHPNRAINLLKQSPKTVLRRLQRIAEEKGLPVEELRKRYTPDTLLFYIFRNRKKEKE